MHNNRFDDHFDQSQTINELKPRVNDIHWTLNLTIIIYRWWANWCECDRQCVCVFYGRAYTFMLTSSWAYLLLIGRPYRFRYIFFLRSLLPYMAEWAISIEYNICFLICSYLMYWLWWSVNKPNIKYNKKSNTKPNQTDGMNNMKKMELKHYDFRCIYWNIGNVRTVIVVVLCFFFIVNVCVGHWMNARVFLSR